jgi:hypothetical protein
MLRSFRDNEFLLPLTIGTCRCDDPPDTRDAMVVVVGMEGAKLGKEERPGISPRSKRSGVKMGSRERALGDIG